MKDVVKEINKRRVTGKFDSRTLILRRLFDQVTLYSMLKEDRESILKIAKIEKTIKSCKNK